MAYTLTQARPLLNAAELALFSESRADAVKQLTAAKLAGAVKRTRTLRDKYRDLYQRQTVAVRTITPGAVTGDDNERTQRKADILQEVLERYEARATLVGERGDSKSSSKTWAWASCSSPSPCSEKDRVTMARLNRTKPFQSNGSAVTSSPAGKNRPATRNPASPMGRLIRKIQCQVSTSTIQPPRIGPSNGPVRPGMVTNPNTRTRSARG